jgi:hypothetical protein
VTYRADEAATRAHLEEERRALHALRARRDDKKAELDRLESLQKDLDHAIQQRQGALLAGDGYFRLAAVMASLLAAGMLEHVVIGAYGGRAGWIVRGVVIAAWSVAAWRATRQQTAAKKALAELDARMAAAEPPRTRVADTTDAATEPEAAAEDRAATARASGSERS